jgi:predicted RNA binding protein YcfA (HicA-like mRNA interferase family)
MLLSKIPLLSAHEIIKILAHFGFKPLRQTGSHIHLVHDENRRLVTVPNHQEIAVGTLLSILKQANIEREEFLHYLK